LRGVAIEIEIGIGIGIDIPCIILTIHVA